MVLRNRKTNDIVSVEPEYILCNGNAGSWLDKIIAPELWESSKGDTIKFPDGIYELGGNCIIIYNDVIYFSHNDYVPYSFFFDKNNWKEVERWLY